MASSNTSRPFGFRPVRYRNGSPFNAQFVLYAFSASDSAVAFVGDVVQFDSTNRAVAITDVYAPGIPLVKAPTAAVTTTKIRGVLCGLLPEPEFSQSATASLGRRHRLASTARYALVIDDYNVVFETQEDGQTYVSASSNAIGKVVDLAYTAGSTVTGISGEQISSADASSGSARPFKIQNYSQRVDNFGFVAADTTSAAKFDVFIANSDQAQGNTGA